MPQAIEGPWTFSVLRGSPHSLRYRRGIERVARIRAVGYHCEALARYSASGIRAELFGDPYSAFFNLYATPIWRMEATRCAILVRSRR